MNGLRKHRLWLTFSKPFPRRLWWRCGSRRPRVWWRCSSTCAPSWKCRRGGTYPRAIRRVRSDTTFSVRARSPATRTPSCCPLASVDHLDGQVPGLRWKKKRTRKSKVTIIQIIAQKVMRKSENHSRKMRLAWHRMVWEHSNSLVAETFLGTK